MDMPKVSIIVPNYNHARFLERRIGSILAQTFQDFELILLDDASTDDSRDILRRFASSDTRIRTDFNAANSGSPFHQWNKGIALAQAPYVWIAESDDVATPDFLQRLLPVLEHDPSLALVYCRSMKIDEQERPLEMVDRSIARRRIPHIDAARWENDFVNNGPDECLSYLFFLNTIPNASAVLFRRDLYLRSGGADSSYRLCGDWWLWVNMLQLGGIAHVAQPLNHYRTHPSTVRSVTERNGQLFIEEYRLMQCMLSRLTIPQNMLDIALQAVASRWIQPALAQGTLFRPANLRILRAARRVDPRIWRRWTHAALCRWAPWTLPVLRRVARLAGRGGR
jgi:glycosyltransferase involved in cell wall biosynthesis